MSVPRRMPPARNASTPPVISSSLSSLPSVYLARAGEKPDAKSILAGLEWINFSARCNSATRIFIKPNLTFPSYRPGVMTSPDFLDALLKALKEFTGHIFIGNSDSGGYNRFSMETVFRSIGLYPLAKKYGAKVVNLTEQPCAPYRVRQGGRERPLNLPALLLEETDLLISVPVPKVHMYTGVSLSLKNLWGCIPSNRDRLLLHPWLEEILPQLVQAMKASTALIDGRIGLNRNGPLRGDPVPLGWILLADDLFAADRTACDILSVDWRRIGHLSIDESMGRPAFVIARTGRNPGEFQTVQFYLRRNPTDWPGWLAFHSPWVAWLAYFSPAAALLHRILYFFRTPFYDYSQTLPLKNPVSGSAVETPARKTASKR